MKKHKITEQDYLKAHRKAGREEEIARHGRPVGLHAVHKSKKAYDRKREKAGLRNLPFPFYLFAEYAGAAYNCSGRVPGVFSGAGCTVTMLSTTNFVNPRQGSAPKYSL